MSNYNSLKTTIDANIKQNGNQEITGQILNSVLNAMVTTLGAGYQFAGVATIDTNPGTPDAKVFYIANGKGKYEKFGGLEVTEDEVVVLYWDSAWHKVATGIASQAKLSELELKIGTCTPLEKGNADNSVILKGEYQGYKNKAISQTSVAIGAATTAGLKGWYYSNIDFTNKKITLSDKPTYIFAGSTLLNGGWSSGTPNIKVDDVISLVNDSKFDLCSKVTEVNGNVITVDSLPFTVLVKDNGAEAAVLAGQFSDGYSLYIPERPDAGIIDFGGGAFSEGSQSKASNICAHAEGLKTHAYGQYSHTEGRENKAAYGAHAEGRGSVASGEYSHAEGYYTKSKGVRSHAEGDNASAEARGAHAEGIQTIASGASSHVEGATSVASGTNSHAEGTNTNATKEAAHSEGARTRANGTYSHAEGSQTQALGVTSHAEGESTVAEGNESHAEGFKTKASGLRSHAEGSQNNATEHCSHVEGVSNNSDGVASHAEGLYNIASGRASHAEGEGNKAEGDRSHASGFHTETKNPQEFALGKYNRSHKETDSNLSLVPIFTIGIGTSNTDRKNAVEVKANGDVYIIGVGGYDGTNSDLAQTLQEILANL